MGSRALEFSDANVDQQELEGTLRVLKLVQHDLYLRFTYLGRDGDDERSSAALKLKFQYDEVIDDLKNRLRDMSSSYQGSVG